MNLPVYTEYTCIHWNYFFFSKLLYSSESYANFKQNSVTVIWRKYHVVMVYFLSQLQRWMGMIRSARVSKHMTCQVGWLYWSFNI